MLADDGLEVAEQGALGVGVLDDRFDHQLGTRRVVELGHRGDAGGDPLRFFRIELALGRQAFERGRKPRTGRLGRAFAGVEDAHRVAGLRRHLGDAGAHDAGADDEDGGVWGEVEGHVGAEGEATARETVSPSHGRARR